MFSIKRTKLFSVFLTIMICFLVLITMSPAAFAAVENDGHGMDMGTAQENSDHSGDQGHGTETDQKGSTDSKQEDSTDSKSDHSNDSTREHTNEEQGHSDGGHGAEEKTVEIQSGDFKIQLITPEKMYEGENNVKLHITKDNLPVKSLDVKLLAQMDQSDSAMNMNHGQEEKPIELTLTESKEGEYSGKVNFEGEGKWLLIAQFSDQETTFEVEVERSGPSWLIVGGFLVVIFSIILTAGILKHKAAKEALNNVSK